MEEGITIKRQTDELTGLDQYSTIDPKDRPSAGKDVRPAVRLVDDKGEALMLAGTDVPAHYFMEANAILSLEDGAHIEWVTLLPVFLRKAQKLVISPVVLPRVADLFEARKPKEAAVLAEITGTVSFGKETKGKRRLVITPQDTSELPEGSDHYEALIPKWRHMTVFEGEHVEKGEVVSDGPENPHDILRLKGVRHLPITSSRKIQDVYRLQGVVSMTSILKSLFARCLRKVEVRSLVIRS